MTHSGALLEGAVWAIVATAATFIVHAVGMGLVVSVGNVLKQRSRSTSTFARTHTVMMVAVAMVIAVHLLEILLWIAGFAWRHSISTVSEGYETLARQSGDVTLLVHWQLLAVATAFLTIAWSAVVLFALSRRLEGSPRLNDADD